MTLKLVALFAVPPGVVMPILPVVAPVGTVAITCVSEVVVGATPVPLNVTLVVWLRPVPVIVTGVPTGPLGGEKLVIVGATRNF